MYILKDWKFYKQVSNEDILKILNWDLNWDLNWYKKTKINKLIILDKPQNLEIEINQETNAETPQAWEHEWNWYYNWLWAIEEAKYRGLHLPSDEEFDDLEYELLELNQINGFRHTNGSLSNRSIGYWWSSTESGSNAWYRYLTSSNSTVHCLTRDKGCGFSVVCTEKPL